MGTPAESSVVGVVGDRTDSVRSAIEAAGGRHRLGDLTTVLAGDPDVLVTVGQAHLLELAALEPTPDVPVLPVNAGPGVESVPLSAVPAAVDALLADEGGTHARPVLAALEGETERARALCDVMLVTAEPARISEYAVRSGGDLVAQFRADGVVVSTPAGTHGYGRSVGAPVVARGTDVVSVVPVAPFATSADHWVLPTGDVTLTIERDEVPVELLADDRRAERVPPHTPLSIARVDSLSIRTVPQSRSSFARSE
ncbi:ATP-NAD kinase [Halorientalis brevis]|uniref:ATP-NAD kinase n=1 Tax=Halorientalis brevis TaxID=1126241 RepID=A0ABD6CI38_9EURY|nr:ATP-NAD kinase [Halorientalis brevis]